MAKLHKANENGVASTDGWSIQVVGPEVLEYREQGNATLLNVEFDPATREITVDASGFEERVRSNVANAVKLLKGKWVVM